MISVEFLLSNGDRVFGQTAFTDYEEYVISLAGFIENDFVRLYEIVENGVPDKRYVLYIQKRHIISVQPRKL